PRRLRVAAAAGRGARDLPAAGSRPARDRAALPHQRDRGRWRRDTGRAVAPDTRRRRSLAAQPGRGWRVARERQRHHQPEGLRAKVGDALTIGYDVWDDAGAMASRQTTLTVGGVLPMTGIGADPTLTPQFPGISDRTTVADWDPSFPVDLSRITPRDEAYWKQYKAAPKALVSYTTAV